MLIGATITVNLDRSLLARIMLMHNRSPVVFRLHCCSQAEFLEMTVRTNPAMTLQSLRMLICSDRREEFPAGCFSE